MGEKAAKTTHTGKTAARLMAVQAVYQVMINAQAAEDVIAEYANHRQTQNGPENGEGEMLAADIPFFTGLVNGVLQRKSDIKEAVQAQLNAEKPPPEPLLKAVLLCGAYELHHHQDIDFPIIISDYVDVTKAFYEDSQASLVNAVLDAVRKSRPSLPPSKV